MKWIINIILSQIITGFLILILVNSCEERIWDNPNDEDRNYYNYGSVSDIDGNVYKTIQIGCQFWMAENLKTKKFRNGDTIPYYSQSSTRGYCWYNHNEDFKDDYGAIYNYNTANDTRGICPAGWHIPSRDEWMILINYLGGDSIAGGLLKESGTSHWDSPNIGATNSSGFTALPGGARDCGGNFVLMGKGGAYWTSETVIDGWIIAIGVNYNNSKVSIGTGFDCNSQYIRCVKD